MWKLLGAVALLIPRFPRLKEWAYAGTFFDMTGALASHVATGVYTTGVYRQFRTLRNHAFRALNPFVSRRFAWQLSGLVDRSSYERLAMARYARNAGHD